MFFRPLVVLSLFGIALATPYRRTDDLTVSVSGPSESVNSVDDLKFTASVTNNGADTVKILKYGTILDEKLPTRSFTVTKDGEEVKFTGIKMSVSLEEVDDTAYTFIKPGETVTVDHEVAHLFDFATAGPGKFTFTPVADFAVNTDSNLSRIAAAPTSVEVEVTGDLAKRELPMLNKRAVDICTTSSKKSFIDASYSEAKTLASTSSSYVSSHGASDSLYRSYFGSNSISRVTSILNAVAGENSGSRTLSCVDSLGACSSGVIAYTVISTTNIYYCSIFFNEVPTANLCSGTSVASRNARGGTTLHEMTHAVGGTDDIIYGCSSDMGLSDSNKIANADNFNCFTTQVYANTRC
ncbi:zincin [Macrolepiota fuliginosa MF-IS2]|uniref:Neutral protease 2 n=1 Tax=Macrolepiota fuliginosa MF-IS2 TaxID=1400762 RepID=A0A9P5WZY8_9AGAR|nr:zincin [Macrolepiota fuliginosa MF-IS2]